ncbi:hypothetical protein TcasGA2_TC031788 [Tribolium castaneum]|uniref:Uncharacterized protein n=1 Tax=Tribolium castaneum TaxID=7070 RepID=A0A139W8H5_TRICA|nr:hypothetical protein TcasGA2_TC031788 [Tribolium castaneum]
MALRTPRKRITPVKSAKQGVSETREPMEATIPEGEVLAGVGFEQQPEPSWLETSPSQMTEVLLQCDIIESPVEPSCADSPQLETTEFVLRRDNIEPQPGPSWADPTNSIEPQPGPSGVSLQTLIQRAGISSGTVLNEREKKLLKFAKILNSRMRRLKKNLKSTKAVHKLYKEENVRHVIENLTPVQQRFILSQLRNVGRVPQGRNFTFEEKADDVAFYKSSPRGYKFLSSIWALPSVRTLQATLNKVPIRPGISKHTFKILSKQKWKDERDRICTLISTTCLRRIKS